MILTLPTYVTIPRKTKEDRKVILNLNVYRNLHHMTNNQAKAEFKKEVHCDCPLPSPPYRFTYTLYQATGRATDVANVCCVVDKFACDALVELGAIPDDNHKVVAEVVYRYGGVDKANPRVELEIANVLMPPVPCPVRHVRASGVSPQDPTSGAE